MPRDIKELLNEGANPPRKGPNMDAVMRRSRTITWQRRAAAAAGVVALCAAAFIVGTRFAPDELTDARPDNIAGTPEDQGGVPVPSETNNGENQDTVGRQVQIELWFNQGEMLVPAYEETTVSVVPESPEAAEGGLIDLSPTELASHGTSVSVAQAAMTRLLEGTASEFEPQGFGTSIPDGTKLLGLTVSAGLGTVNLSSEFESGGGSLSMQMRVAQVVWTMTQVQHIDSVVFEIEGERITSLGGEGIDVTQPQARQNWMQFAPPVAVDSPRRGDIVTSPVAVTGTANTFEATVQMRIVDADGNEIGPEIFTTATCGSGCRGDYEDTIEFNVTEEQVGYLEAYSRSAENGEPMFMVRIPVILTP